MAKEPEVDRGPKKDEKAAEKAAAGIKRPYTILVNSGKFTTGDVVEMTDEEAKFHGPAVVAPLTNGPK